MDFNNLFWYRVLIIWSRVFIIWHRVFIIWYRVLIIWHRVGKTAIISQFLYDQFCSEYKPTVITLSYYACDNVEKKYVGATFMCEAISSSHKVTNMSLSMMCLLKVASRWYVFWKWKASSGGNDFADLTGSPLSRPILIVLRRLWKIAWREDWKDWEIGSHTENRNFLKD